ncbi:DUF4365 domain-containing protein [Tissierella sp. MSJ-40]|uniref:DUF4365 domain-containing protein n=1 Tax=Tissierella simiarum TaxID=2841534 RepID=A0ABS6EAA8_9FIRM|nr:DUF4365 domain-containing protein [Tissierella simiarum]MBU5439865.1 DUF4365 domain-containing protein [Tissierella simiarum]
MSDNNGRIGVSRVQSLVYEELMWIFREQAIDDYGIDAHIEIRNSGRATGQLIAVQIKSGVSYFREIKENSIVFRSDARHLSYWINHSLPVIIILYNPDTTECIWEYINMDTAVKVSDTNYKILISRENIFNGNAKVKLEQLTSYSDPSTYLISSEKKMTDNSTGNKDMYIDEIILNNGYQCYYSYGLGLVRIEAYLPVSIEQSLSCCITFQQAGLSDCMITFDEDLIENILFTDCDKGLTEERKFITYIDDDKVGIDFPNNRFVIDVETAQQLCEIIKGLHKSYLKRKQELYSIIGASDFKEEGNGKFKIIRVPINIWIEMVDFAQEHDHSYGNTKWDIFHPLNLYRKDHIIIYKNHLDKVKADVLVELYVRDISGNFVDIVWKAGNTPLTSKMDGFDNLIKWKVNYTHDWILNEFIPYIFYLNMQDKRNNFEKLFKNRIKFEEFKDKFNYSLYNIESLAYKNNVTLL